MTPQEWKEFVEGMESVEANSLAGTGLSIFYLFPVLGWATALLTAGGFKEDLMKKQEEFCAQWNQKGIGGGKVQFAARHITHQIFVVDVVLMA